MRGSIAICARLSIWKTPTVSALRIISYVASGAPPLSNHTLRPVRAHDPATHAPPHGRASGHNPFQLPAGCIKRRGAVRSSRDARDPSASGRRVIRHERHDLDGSGGREAEVGVAEPAATMSTRSCATTIASKPPTARLSDVPQGACSRRRSMVPARILRMTYRLAINVLLAEPRRRARPETGRVRAADLVGQLGDPHYLRKTNALFHEFAETGLNEQLGFSTPADLVGALPGILLGPGRKPDRAGGPPPQCNYGGRRWIAHLHANVFGAERYLRLGGPQP